MIKKRDFAHGGGLSAPNTHLDVIDDEHKEALFHSLRVTVSALSYLNVNLCEVQDHGPIPQGLRDALVSLIERNEELALKLIDVAKHAISMEKLNYELLVDIENTQKLKDRSTRG